MKYPKNKKVAFDIEQNEWRCTAYWGDDPDAVIVIRRNKKIFKKFHYPSYKIFNIAAHFGDIVEDFEKGMAIASSPF